MAQVLKHLPELSGEELRYVAEILKQMSEEEAAHFASIYRARRRDPMLILLCSVAGLVIIPGLQRFILNQIGMGLLYLFTIGLCFIGSIVDIVNYNRMTFEYNSKVAQEVLIIMNNSVEGK